MNSPYDVILKPAITERSMDDAQEKRYTFKVHKNASKTQIKLALVEIFGVDIKKVNVMNVKGKKKRMGRSEGRTSDSKKAIVILTPKSKEIEFFKGL